VVCRTPCLDLLIYEARLIAVQQGVVAGSSAGRVLGASHELFHTNGAKWRKTERHVIDGSGSIEAIG
jgi:hypothetical protein